MANAIATKISRQERFNPLDTSAENAKRRAEITLSGAEKAELDAKRKAVDSAQKGLVEILQSAVNAAKELAKVAKADDTVSDGVRTERGRAANDCQTAVGAAINAVYAQGAIWGLDVEVPRI